MTIKIERSRYFNISTKKILTEFVALSVAPEFNSWGEAAGGFNPRHTD
ncbi:hypothetical protein [Gloeocapsopsis dulcis]|nr:hypothetical protein [Gloeocapsopsis dulcis]WNN88238.1 hypothetical protein P0S91_18350 [Gloeocapsopsis dulcis]